MVPDVLVSSGDTYQIMGNSQFAKDLREVTDITMAHKGNYQPHVSLD